MRKIRLKPKKMTRIITRRLRTCRQKRSEGAVDWIPLAMAIGKKRDAALIFKDNAANVPASHNKQKRLYEQ